MQYVRTGTHTGIANHFVTGLGSSSNRAALQKALTAGVQEAELCRHRSEACFDSSLLTMSRMCFEVGLVPETSQAATAKPERHLELDT